MQRLWTTVLNFSRMDPELARHAYNLGRDARDWKITLAQEDLRESGPSRDHIVPILYRPFDLRYTYYTGRSRGFHCRPRPEIMRHMLAGENMALIVPRRVEHLGGWQHAFVTKAISEHVAVSLKTIDYHFPLYLYPDAEREDLFSDLEPQERRPNLNEELMGKLEEAYNPTPVSPPRKRGGEQGEGYGWYTPPHLWEKLKPLAREMRRNPTPAEKKLWQHLRRRQLLGYKFRRQHAIDRFIVDFYCQEAKLVVEVDGPIHQYTPQEDAIRREFLESLGLRVIRFTNEQVLSNIESVLEAIASALQEVESPNPPASASITPEQIFHYIYAVLYAPPIGRNTPNFCDWTFRAFHFRLSGRPLKLWPSLADAL